MMLTGRKKWRNDSRAENGKLPGQREADQKLRQQMGPLLLMAGVLASLLVAGHLLRQWLAA